MGCCRYVFAYDLRFGKYLLGRNYKGRAAHGLSYEVKNEVYKKM
jgi:hypothetical protein